MKNQTAVEWYCDRLLEILGDKVNEFTIEQTLANHSAIIHAKRMEEQQIIDAFNKGMNDSVDYYIPYDDSSEAEIYYKETYKK